ncbi:Hypothetical predicted protein [Mytilus galloprovincialis]|uniref:Uncharacterized protein n=1 Tax=Mytilus galloprovincialis TaxID=29158 RepID=A0A8B6CC39_MYTGA|nr:Hypothetical predicted protein [Mytilus galloprovincialis]
MYTTESSLVNTKPGLGKINRDQDTITTSTVAVIGGVLGACFILTVSTVMIVCKIRSKGIFKESDKHEKRETSQLHSSKTINQDSTIKRNKKLNDLCESCASGYSVANYLDKPENINEIYTDAADGEYDILHNKQNRRICPKENVYHSHGAYRSEEGPTYDSASYVTGNSNDGNELYDTSFSVVEGNYSYMSYKNRDNEMLSDIYDKSNVNTI